MMRYSARMFGVLLLAAGCSAPETREVPETAATEMTTLSGALPASAEEAQARLAASPRHGEWAIVHTSPTDSVRAWVVYPERSTPAPVIVVVHEIFGLSHWVRAVADQFAAEGFIAIAPDLLTMNNIPLGGDGAPDADIARAQIATLNNDVVHQQLLAVAEYGMSLPAAEKRYGIVGYCWGGGISFEHAIRSPSLGASVVYYGTSPDTTLYGSINAPILGLYGGNDERVNATIPRAQEAMARLGKRYEAEIFAGAGHGFLRQQDGMDGANLRATEAAWPRTIAWFRENLER